MNDVMVDLETMGTGGDAAIIAIGAVMFDRNGLGDRFYKVIDLSSSVAGGGVIDPSTVLWWMKQGDAARAEFAREGRSIIQVLLDFSTWLPRKSKIWGNGATFDNVILASAYKRALLPVPWKYWDDRCYRTVAAMRPNISKVVRGTAHNALDDAEGQALHLIEVLTDIG